MTGSRVRRRSKSVEVGALLLALALSGQAWAGAEDAGTAAASFLSLGSGARAHGMGGATLGLGDDVEGAAWNAAALGWLEDPQAALSHAGVPGHRLEEWVTYGGRAGRSRTRWGLAGLYQGEGAIEGRDATGLSTGSFSVTSLALGATVARPVRERLSVGVGGKYVRERLGLVTGSGVTFDAGVMARHGRFGFGAAAQNLLGRMGYGSASYPFPTSFGAGVAYTHAGRGLRVALDANLPSGYHPDLRAGVEWTYRGTAAFRGGYRWELGSPGDPLTGASVGLGAGRNGLWVDYGYLVSSAGEGEHRLGLRFDLGRLVMGGVPRASHRPEDWSTGGPSLIGPPPPGKSR